MDQLMNAAPKRPYCTPSAVLFPAADPLCTSLQYAGASRGDAQDWDVFWAG